MRELSSLVNAAQRGDKEAFGQIVLRFQDMAYASAYAMLGDPWLAQDAAQEAFIDAYLSLPKLREPAAFPGWFRRIILKHSDRAIRSRQPAFVPLEFAVGLDSPVPGPVDLVEQAQLQANVQNAIALLPADQRLAIALFYIEGYSQREIAGFLEVPVTTVKKRLFDARKKLKERLLQMVQNELQATRPSQNDQFATKVRFFVALRERDLPQVRELVAQYPELLGAKTEWQMALGHHYWPLGSTALHLAAATGATELLTYLLTQPVDVNDKDPAGMKPLHLATILRQPESVRLLLAHGAAVDAANSVGQTALHHATLRGHLELAQLLIEHGADPNATDHAGRTPLDWAMIRRNQALIDLLSSHRGTKSPHLPIEPGPDGETTTLRTVPTGPSLRGRILDAHGEPLDGQQPPPAGGRRPLVASATPAKPVQLVTGIKIIDLLAPIPRGGFAGVFTPLAGVGLMVVIGQLIDSVDALHGGTTVYLTLEGPDHRAADQQLSWRELGVDEKMITIVAHAQDEPYRQLIALETGLTIAEELRRQGNDVLLMIDSRFASVTGAMTYLRANTVSTAAAAITTLFYGHHTVGLEPPPLQGLDAVLTFDLVRATYRLYPAIDPVRSSSRLLESALLAPEHQEVAAAVRRLLHRYADLRLPMEMHRLGLDTLWYIYDDPNVQHDIGRARKLDRFLTQPQYSAEPWTGIAGEWVSVEETVAACRALVKGHYDEWPEEVFAFVGSIEQARRKLEEVGN